MQIYIIEPGNIRRTYNIPNNTITVGRESNNIIQVNDQKISRNHCVITQYGNTMTLKDLQSRNGTYLNGSRINSGVAYPITTNSGIRIGSTYIAFHPGSSIANNVIEKNQFGYQRVNTSPQRVSSFNRGDVPVANLNLNFGSRGGLGNEMEYSYHANKSYVGHAVGVIFLYYFGFMIIGFIVNLIFLNAAKNTRRIIQRDPPGYVFLQVVLWIHVGLVAIGTLVGIIFLFTLM
jgi:FOG: FHA domain